MLAIHLLRRFHPQAGVHGSAPLFGVTAGFATTVANAAGTVMNLYLLSKRLPKEQFVATGAWFFFVLNLLKIPIYAWYHLFGRASLTFNLMEVPIVLAGALAGRWLVRAMPQSVFEALVIVLTVLCAIALFFWGMWGGDEQAHFDCKSVGCFENRHAVGPTSRSEPTGVERVRYCDCL